MVGGYIRCKRFISGPQRPRNTMDLRDWGIPLGRPFRALKLWFTIRSYGVSGIQRHIRNHCELAKEFEALAVSDGRFEIVGKVTLGLVCFRVKGPNILTQTVLEHIQTDGRLFLGPGIVRDVYFLRLAICAERATTEDIRVSFHVIKECTDLAQITML